MRKNYFWQLGFGLLLAWLVILPGRAQRMVKLATGLDTTYRYLARTPLLPYNASAADNLRLKKVVRYCKSYFEVLAQNTGKAAAVEELKNAYSANEILGQQVNEVYEIWKQAGRLQQAAADIAEKKKAQALAVQDSAVKRLAEMLRTKLAQLAVELAAAEGAATRPTALPALEMVQITAADTAQARLVAGEDAARAKAKAAAAVLAATLQGIYWRRTGVLTNESVSVDYLKTSKAQDTIVIAALPLIRQYVQQLTSEDLKKLKASPPTSAAAPATPQLVPYLWQLAVVSPAERREVVRLLDVLQKQKQAISASEAVANQALVKFDSKISIDAKSISGSLATGGQSFGGSLAPATASSLRAAASSPARAGTSSLEASLVDGTARFLAERFKRELNAAFFQRFAAILRDTTYVEVGYLFPSTARLLGSGTADYGTIIQTLRGTFERDLQELFFNYGELLGREPRYRRRLRGEGDVAQALRYSFLATKATYYLSRGTHPADLPRRLAADLVAAGLPVPIPPYANAPAQADTWSLKTGKTLQVLQVLSDALLDEEALTQAWMPQAVLKDKLKSPSVRFAFAGLLWQQALPLLPGRIPADPDASLNRALRLMMDFTNLSGEMEKQARHLRHRADSAKLRVEDFVPLYQSVQRGLEFAVQVTQPQDDMPCALARLARLQKMGDALLQGYIAADRGDYGVTLSSFLDLVLLASKRTVLVAGQPCDAPLPSATFPRPIAPATPKPVALAKPTERQVQAVALADQKAGAVAALSLSRPTPDLFTSLGQVVRYGSFMASVAQAKNADDVKDALEAAALPVGSSSIKRRSFRSISVNAFVGVTAGAEYAYLDNQLNHFADFRPNLGPTAPLGLALSWGRRGNAQALRLRAARGGAERARWLVPEFRARLGSHTRQGQLRRLDELPRYYAPSGRDAYLRGASWTIFGSIVDLGVPVLFRLNDANAATLPRNIDFRHVLAPGLFAVYGFPRSPVSAFAGVQFTPQLRQLQDLDSTTAARAGLTENTNTFRNSLRFNVGLTVDIPIFQLGTRTEPAWPSPGRWQVAEQARRDSVEMRVLTALRGIVESNQLDAATFRARINTAIALTHERHRTDLGWATLGSITHTKVLRLLHAAIAADSLRLRPDLDAQVRKQSANAPLPVAGRLRPSPAEVRRRTRTAMLANKQAEKELTRATKRAKKGASDADKEVAAAQTVAAAAAAELQLWKRLGADWEAVGRPLRLAIRVLSRRLPRLDREE